MKKINLIFVAQHVILEFCRIFKLLFVLKIHFKIIHFYYTKTFYSFKVVITHFKNSLPVITFYKYQCVIKKFYPKEKH